ncbi:MAG TPA: glycosyltransferase family 1 protein [Candidatus Paceibacterota bacterium]|nr:glycosyltransferase family 1 protein [Candidatus Paceibacterota bacterium]
MNAGDQNTVSREMKKIVIVTDTWSPQINGVVRVLQALIPRLEARGYAVTLIEPGQFKTVPLPFYSEVRLALFPRHRIVQILDTVQPDAVCIVTEGPLGWAARGVCMQSNRPFVTWYHSHFQLYVDVRLHGLLAPIHAALKRFHSTAVATMVSTESLRKEMLSVGFKNLLIMPLGVDTKLFVRNPTPPIPLFPKPIFVYFSRLATEKSPEEFLKLKLPGTKLVIGDGPLRAKLEKIYGTSHHFVGYKRGQELVDWLSCADVFIFPSRTETFGLVALEALACGIPVAAHRVMGPRDIITEGKDGYLSDDLQEAAIKCLELSPEECRKKALLYSWERSVDAFIKNMSESVVR